MALLPSVAALLASLPFAIMTPIHTDRKLIQTTQRMGQKIRLIPLSIDAQTLQHIRSLHQNIRAFFLQYPLRDGTYYSPEVLKKIVDYCEQHDLFIIADETYGDTTRFRETLFDLMDDPNLIAYVETHLAGVIDMATAFGLSGTHLAVAYSLSEKWIAVLNQTAPINQRDLKMAQAFFHPDFQKPYLQAHIQWLEKKRDQIVHALNPYRRIGMVHFLNPTAGYVLELDLSALLGKSFSLNGKNYTLADNGSNLPGILKKVGLFVKPVKRGRKISGIQVTYALDQLQEVICRLNQFFKLFLSTWVNTGSKTLQNQKLVETRLWAPPNRRPHTSSASSSALKYKKRRARGRRLNQTCRQKSRRTAAHYRWAQKLKTVPPQKPATLITHLLKR